MAFPKSGSSHAGLAVDSDILLENYFSPNDKMSLSPAGLNFLGSSSIEYARAENKHLFVSKIGITFEFEIAVRRVSFPSAEISLALPALRIFRLSNAWEGDTVLRNFFAHNSAILIRNTNIPIRKMAAI